MMRPAMLLVAFLAGCSTVQYTPNATPAAQNNVRVLYEYPHDRKFKSLGTIQANIYRPGMHAPAVSDTLPELTAKAAAVGGNALIVRNSQVGQFDRSIAVTAEVLALEPASTP